MTCRQPDARWGRLHRRGGAAAIVAAVIALAAAGTATAQIVQPAARSARPAELPDPAVLESTELSPELLGLIDLLGSDAWSDREAAMGELVGDRHELLELLAILHRGVLDLEQRHRLLSVVRAKLLSRPRGALGITMREMLGRPGVQEVGRPVMILVTKLHNGLPAKEVLLENDMIIAVDERLLFDQQDLVRHVQHKLPGESVRLKILRAVLDQNGAVQQDAQGQVIRQEHTIELELGCADDLRDPDTDLPVPDALRNDRLAYADAAAERYSPRPEKVQFETRLAAQVDGEEKIGAR